MEGKRVISTHELFPIIQETLRSVSSVIFTVSGDSMRPWIVSRRDRVKLIRVHHADLKKGDIILFQNNQGNYILHRICKLDRESVCTIGDACLKQDGFIHPSQIIGVVDKIYRKGKEIDCNAFFWRLVFLLWLKLLPIRKYLLKLYFFISRSKCNVRKLLLVFRRYCALIKNT